MGEIPNFPAGTIVSYRVIAYDYAGNFAIEDNMGQLIRLYRDFQISNDAGTTYIYRSTRGNFHG